MTCEHTQVCKDIRAFTGNADDADAQMCRYVYSHTLGTYTYTPRAQLNQATAWLVLVLTHKSDASSECEVRPGGLWTNFGPLAYDTEHDEARSSPEGLCADYVRNPRCKNEQGAHCRNEHCRNECPV